MRQRLNNDWDEVLKEEFNKPYYQELRQFLQQEYKEQVIYPKKEEVMTAFTLTAYKDVKVVVLGQDPYHGPGQAHGLSFSVQRGVAFPPSLRNIFKELQHDLQCAMPLHGDLTHWAMQGVLLLNTVLTVRAGEAHSHRQKGWEKFTDAVIHQLANREEPIVFILWGRPAQSKKQWIDMTKHVVIESAHPSPLSAYRGFFGSRPFSRANTYLESWGVEPIDWCGGVSSLSTAENAW